MKQIYHNADQSAGSGPSREEMKNVSGMDTILQTNSDNQNTAAETETARTASQISEAGQYQYPGGLSRNDTNGSAVMYRGGVPRTESEYTKKLKDNFGPIGIAAMIYAIFYTFCMYKNSSGITSPFFAAGSLLFFCFCLQKLGISLKKGSIFYMTGILLLAVSTFSTDDGRIILFNKLGIFLLLISLLLKQLYDTSSWKLGRYLINIFLTTFVSLGEIARPFQDMAGHYRTKIKGRQRKTIYICIGAAFAVPLFLLVFSLLASADAVFRDMTRQITQSLELGNLFHMFFMTAFMFMAAYCIMAFLCKRTLLEEVKDRRGGEPLIAITITLLLTILYLMFSAVQIIYLFLGRMQLPDGYTYAEYAREGFFQLLFVSILNLVIVLVCLSFFRSSKVLKIILTIMSLCTFIMIASSAMRMIIYIQYYYLTFLRILVLWTLAVLFLMFAGVTAAIFCEKFPLFRYGMATVTICYLLLSFSHPDYWIARTNLSNTDASRKNPIFQGETYQDYHYLSSLNLDAAPAILPYLQQNGYSFTASNPDSPITSMGNRYLNKINQKTETQSLRTFNTSRYLAHKKLQNISLQK